MGAEQRSKDRFFVLIVFGGKREQLFVLADNRAYFETLEEAKRYVHKIRSGFESNHIPEILIVKEVARYRAKKKANANNIS